MWAPVGFVGKWFRKYLFFSKATVSIQGLVFSHSFVNHAIVLITYLPSTWEHPHPHSQVGAIVTNVQEGVSGVMVIVLAHFSHSHIGGFKIIGTTNVAYILGLLMLWLSAAAYVSADAAARVFYGAVTLLALGEAGRSAALNEFLDNQYISQKKPSECTNEKELESRAKALWDLPWFLGAIVPLFLLKTTWAQIFMISTIAMAFSYLLFLSGYSYYYITKTENARAIEERQDTHIDTEANNVAQEQRQDPSEITEGGGKFWTLLKKLKHKKGFFKEIFALCLAFLGYSTVTAAGSTFFFEPMSNLESPFTNYDPAVYFKVLSSFSRHLVSYLCLLIPRKWESSATRLRIGCGMACTVLCCLAAWQVELHRIKKTQSADNTAETISMSIFWFVPQFVLLGLMEGFATDGYIDFIVDRVDADDKVLARYYGSHTSKLMVGVGKLITALSILAFRRRWFNDNINLSRLDKYYRALTSLTLAIVCYYFCVAFHFYNKDKSEKSTTEECQQSRTRNENVEEEIVHIP